MRTNCSHFFFSNSYFVDYYIDYYLYFDKIPKEKHHTRYFSDE